jgi:hypothetical protein
MKNNPPTMSTGRVTNIIALNYQHLKKAKNIAATLVTMVVRSKLTFSPVAA